MKLSAILEGVPLNGGAIPELDVQGISYHSRETRQGDLFVAMTGRLADGHDHIDQAVAAGAAAVLCQRPPADCPVPVLATPDSRRALAAVSANFFGHPEERLTLIGVTGTNGKTTTTWLIKQLLEAVTGARVGLIGTNQNMVGEESLPARRTTPESCEVYRLLREMADSGCRYAVMEVSSHALALDRVAGLHFRAGVFTNLTQDHLDFHKTMEDYRRAKGLLFRQCDTAVLNLDDEAGRYYAQHVDCPCYTYSENKDTASLTAKNMRLFPRRVEFEALTDEAIARVRLPIPGGFSIYNALAALACGRVLGLELEEMARAMAGVQGVRGRVEVVDVPADFTVLIDYAHTPDALENILYTVRGFAEGRVILVFGCGGDRDRSKRPIMGQIAGELADYVIVTSDNPRTEPPMTIIGHILEGMGDSRVPREVLPDRRAAIARALELGRSGDVILLAGKGHETYQTVGIQNFHLDEREEVAAWFAGRAPAGASSGE